MNVRRHPARRRLTAQVRQLASSWVLLAAAFVVLGLVVDSFLTHRLDRLRMQSIELAERLDAAVRTHEQACSDFELAAAYEAVVPRAGAELGFVENGLGEKHFVRLSAPLTEPDASRSFWARAVVEAVRGVDRYANVRNAMAQEEDEAW